jgi:hypothetical protein
MLTFTWKRKDRPRHGILWELWHDNELVGRCFYLSGIKRFTATARAPVKGGAVLCDYLGGTSASARRALERDWCKRSIGLFGVDDIEFVVEA